MSLKDLELATIGVLTALPKEFAATCEVFKAKEVDVPGKGAGRKYAVAKIKIPHGGTHIVAIAQTGMANNSAATRVVLMKQHCVNVEHILMVGIAGAVPHPTKPEAHVRLGDLIVSDQQGVVQFDNIKLNPNGIVYRHPPRPPGALLLDAVNALRVAEARSEYPWEKYIDEAIKAHPKWRRPEDKWDTLKDDVKKKDPTEHPQDDERRAGHPCTFYGPIGSSNTLLKDPRYRDVLRDKFGIKAVEMETSGVADAAWNLELWYLAVRSGCDYCNPAKGDRWQAYAAVAAAAYARCVVEAIPSSGKTAAKVPLNKGTPSPATLAKAVGKLQRSRDLKLLKEAFGWLHMDIFDYFFDRLGYQRITLHSITMFQGFERTVTRHDFQLIDRKLAQLVKTLYERWVDCVRYVDEMDLSNNGHELFFRMPGDAPASIEQLHAHNAVRTAVTPLHRALRALCAYVAKNYTEIDFKKAGKSVLGAIKESKT